MSLVTNPLGCSLIDVRSPDDDRADRGFGEVQMQLGLPDVAFHRDRQVETGEVSDVDGLAEAVPGVKSASLIRSPTSARLSQVTPVMVAVNASPAMSARRSSACLDHGRSRAPGARGRPGAGNRLRQPALFGGVGMRPDVRASPLRSPRPPFP